MKKYFTSFVAATSLASFVAACGKKTNVKKSKKLTILESKLDTALTSGKHTFEKQKTNQKKDFVDEKTQSYSPVVLQKQQLKIELKKYFNSHYYTTKSEKNKFDVLLEKLNNYDFSEKDTTKMDSSVLGFSTQDLNFLSTKAMELLRDWEKNQPKDNYENFSQKNKWDEALSLVNKKSFGGKINYEEFGKKHPQLLFSKNDKPNSEKEKKVKKLLTDHNFYHRNVNHDFTSQEIKILTTKVKEFLSKGKGLSSLRFYLWELDKYENLQMDYNLFIQKHLDPYFQNVVKDYKKNPHYQEVKTMLRNHKFYNKDLDKVYHFKDGKGFKYSLKSFTNDEVLKLRKLTISYLIRHNPNELNTDDPKTKDTYWFKYSKTKGARNRYVPNDFHTKDDILKYLKSIDKY